MDSTVIIQKTIAFVKDTLKHAEGGHDWWHIERVLKNARDIAKVEDANLLVVELAALLHDIADSKFHNGDEDKGPVLAGDFLESIGVEPTVTTHVQNIIRYMSFKSSFDAPVFSSIEMQIVQDADRLDAIGAIGIARAFNYGGYKGRPIYDRAVIPEVHGNKESYKNSSAPSLNHFYEKLLLLKDRMNTAAGKEIAQQRHQFMETYLQQLAEECDLKM